MEANAALADRFNEHAQHFGQLIEKYVRLERNSKTAVSLFCFANITFGVIFD